MLTLNIATPERRVAGPMKVASVTVPGTNGEMTVLPGHARLLSTLRIGVLAFENEKGARDIAAVSGGFVEVDNDEVTVLADTLELAKEIDVERARRAQQGAEEKLKAKEHFEQDMADYQAALERALIRLEVAQHLLPPH